MNKSLKNLLILINLFLFIFLEITLIQAQQNQTPNSGSIVIKHEGLPAPGLLPTSPFYFIKRIFENIGTFLTFGAGNKAARHFELAQKRLAEAEELVSQKNFEKAKSIFERYEKELQKTQNYLEKAELKGQDMSKLAERILKILPISPPIVGEQHQIAQPLPGTQGTEITVGEQRQAEEVLEKVQETAPVQAQKGLETTEQVLQRTAQKILVRKQSEQVTQSLQVFSQYKGSDKFGQCDSFTPLVIGDDIQDTKALGFGWARPFGDVFAQETIEKQKGSYNFSMPDATVKKLQSAGLKIFGNLFPTGIPRIPQSVNITSFENYVKAIVDRYNGDGKNDMPGLVAKITYWQVGIEPFCTTSGESCYKNFFDLVKSAYQAAKSFDPSLMISPGGPAPIFDPNGNIDKMASAIFGYFFENGGAQYMDFFNFHYLVGAKNHDIKKYIDYWKKYIPQDKEIWLSETGSRDVGDRHIISSNTQEEANWVRKHISDSFQNGVSKIFWCRAEHSYSDMLEVVKVLQEYAKQYGGNPMGSIVKRQIQQKSSQSSQQSGGTMPQGEIMQQEGQQQSGGMIQQPGEMMHQSAGETQQPSGFFQGGGYCGDGRCDSIEQQSGGCPSDCRQNSGTLQPNDFQQPGGNFQQPGGIMQGGGYCGDNQCDSIEQQTGGCPQDCQ